MKKATIYLNEGFGKKPVSGYIIVDFKIFKFVQFTTRWDGGAFTTTNRRLKLPWNAVEVQR